MNPLLIGNALCLIGSVLIPVSGIFKTKKNFLLSQAVINLILSSGNIFLGGYSGAIVGFVSLARNLLSIRFKLNTWLKLIFIALQVGLTVYFGITDPVMWLPVIGNALFTWFIDTDNMLLLKTVSIISQFGWLVYDFHIMNYASVPFDIAFIITSVIAIIKILSEKRNCES